MPELSISSNRITLPLSTVVSNSKRYWSHRFGSTNDTVYIGGQFTAANGQPRARLAAFRADNGALTTWAPQADYTVNAMVLSPDKSRLVLGGGFQNINGSPAYGLAAVDIRSSALLPFAANQKVREAGGALPRESASARVLVSELGAITRQLALITAEDQVIVIAAHQGHRGPTWAE